MLQGLYTSIRTSIPSTFPTYCLANAYSVDPSPTKILRCGESTLPNAASAALKGLSSSCFGLRAASQPRQCLPSSTLP
jgi:hypothetical protein